MGRVDWTALVRRERAASAISYALLLGLVAVLSIGAVQSVGDSVTELFGDVGEDLGSVGTGGTSPGDDDYPPRNQAPVAVDDPAAGSEVAFTTDEDTAFTTGNVLANDSDLDLGDTLRVTSIDTSGTIGSVTNNGDGTFDYDPNGQFEGLDAGDTASDRFSYTVSDGTTTASATVTVTVRGLRSLPFIEATISTWVEGTFEDDFTPQPGILAGASDVAIDGDTAWVTAPGDPYDSESAVGALVAVDISDINNLSIVGHIEGFDQCCSLPPLRGVEAIALDGDTAWVVNPDLYAVAAFDISNRSAPSYLGGVSDFNILWGANDIAIKGEVAWVVSDYSDTVTAIDISTPTNPTILGSISNDDTAEENLEGVGRIAIDGNIAYVSAKWSNAFSAIDISDPLNPTLIDSVSTDDEGALGWAKGFALDGNTAWVAARDADVNAVTAIDISDPSNLSIGITVPALNSSLEGFSTPDDVVADDDRIWVTDGAGVTAADISDPANPIRLDDTNIGSVNMIGINRVVKSGPRLWIPGSSYSALTAIRIRR